MSFYGLKLNRQAFIIAGAFLVGLLIGWLLIGWLLWPVKWINADPWDLLPEFKKEYVRMAADSYEITPDVELLKKRFSGWPREDLSLVFQELREEHKGESKIIKKLDAIKDVLGIQVKPAPETQPAPPPPKGKGINLIGILVLLICLVLGIVLGQFLYRRFLALRKAEELQPAEGEFIPETAGLSGLVRVFNSVTYTYGDLKFDESFPIEEGEEYLGECGIGSAEVIGSGDPPKITAFELWLFDKNDVRTVTKIIASEYAYNEETMREALSSKASTGEVVLAEPGKEVELETASLRLKARIKDMAYGNGEPLPGSYFTKFSVDIEVYRKPGTTEQEATAE